MSADLVNRVVWSKTRAWMGVNASEEDSPFTAPAAPPYARLANFLADLADSFWRCACACVAWKQEDCKDAKYRLACACSAPAALASTVMRCCDLSKQQKCLG